MIGSTIKKASEEANRNLLLQNVSPEIATV